MDSQLRSPERGGSRDPPSGGGSYDHAKRSFDIPAPPGDPPSGDGSYGRWGPRLRVRERSYGKANPLDWEVDFSLSQPANGLMSQSSTLQPSTSYLARFGLTSFRPGQEEVVRNVLEGKDVLCVMPTGGGKSLCYQLPSLAMEGTTLVVSPLIALMKDQVDVLEQRGIPAALLNSTLSGSEQAQVMQQMAAGRYAMVYVAPERLRTRHFQDAVRTANVSLLAVDEAHCMSEWGHDFRPDYARLGMFRERYLNNVQTIALTATATPTVRDDIQSLLNMRQPKCFVTGFARKNLHFGVTHTKGDREKDEAVLEYLRQQSGTGIIYAATRKRCEELAEWLPEKLGRRVGVYHAGLDGRQRQEVQEAFMAGELSAIVATNAFGMGIDKSDLRYVVHYNMPGSLEAYYQEAGRAGRDGLPSECRLFFAYSDRYVQEFFIENRYPSADTVRDVYRYLLSRSEDPIELTLQQVKDALGGKISAESVSTAEALLARAGVLKRLDSSANHAVIRIDSDLATLQDLLPREAKIRRKVMAACEKVVGSHRGEDVYVRPSRLADLAGLEREQLARSLRELTRLQAFDYIPPFRGRAVHFLRRDVPFEELEIDFEELARRKAAEYEKLEAVVSFARNGRCRQLAILDYFGDPNAERCGNCDLCCPPGKTSGSAAASKLSAGVQIKGVDSEVLTRGVRIALSGLARMHGRFGKQMVAQMLCGSQNKKMQQWKLNRLSTYGMLSGLKQTQVSELLDAICDAGLAEQVEVDERRPTMRLSELGQEVMKGQAVVPASLRLPFPLAKRLAACAASHEAGDMPKRSSEDSEASDPVGSGEGADAQASDATPHPHVLSKLKSWRRKVTAALGIPAYRVLSNATMERIAIELPADTEQLGAVKGIGPATVEQFGYDIVEMVASAGSLPLDPDPLDAPAAASAAATASAGDPQSVDSDHPTLPSGSGDAATPGVQASPAKQPASAESSAAVVAPVAVPAGRKSSENAADDFYWTWRLFSDGYSIEEVLQIRRSDTPGIIGDLLAAADAGHPVRLGWVAAAEQQRVLQTWRELPAEAGQREAERLSASIDPQLLALARRIL